MARGGRALAGASIEGQAPATRAAFLVPGLVLGAVLLAFGAGMGAMDCTMNIQAVLVERDAGRPLMSGFHAFYSVGSLAGAVGAAGLLTAGLPVLALAAALGAAACAPRPR